jgi:hypothetical protein
LVDFFFHLLPWVVWFNAFARTHLLNRNVKICLLIVRMIWLNESLRKSFFIFIESECFKCQHCYSLSNDQTGKEDIIKGYHHDELKIKKKFHFQAHFCSTYHIMEFHSNSQSLHSTKNKSWKNNGKLIRI